MKTKWIIGLMAVATFASCGGDEQKEEESTEKKDTVTEVKDTVPAYEYKFAVSEEVLPTRWWVYIGDSTSIATLEGFFMKNQVTIGDFSKKNKVTAPVMAAYDGFSVEKKFYTRVGVPVTDSTMKVKGNMKLEKVNGGNAVKTVVTGNYDQLHSAWDDVMHYVGEKGLTPNGSGWEVYNVSHVNEKDTTKWETIIYLPVANK